jgi:hypothetical protein
MATLRASHTLLVYPLEIAVFETSMAKANVGTRLLKERDDDEEEEVVNDWEERYSDTASTLVNDFMRLFGDDDVTAKGVEGGPLYPEKIEPATTRKFHLLNSSNHFCYTLGC